ncbi:MAG: hypothetical protein H0X18_09120 [Geodermatophilaceae bacterium]|nr:hypothetical protein [Geodermatophilaceae bacterium]
MSASDRAIGSVDADAVDEAAKRLDGVSGHTSARPANIADNKTRSKEPLDRPRSLRDYLQTARIEVVKRVV